MLERKYRLLVPISKTAQLFSTPQFSLRVSKNGESVSRFGFIVSKKIDKRAVVRNRVKRLLRRVIEENIKKIAAGYDFLFIIRSEIIGKDLGEISITVLDLLKKEKLYD